MSSTIAYSLVITSASFGFFLHDSLFIVIMHRPLIPSLFRFFPTLSIHLYCPLLLIPGLHSIHNHFHPFYIHTYTYRQEVVLTSTRQSAQREGRQYLVEGESLSPDSFSSLLPQLPMGYGTREVQSPFTRVLQ